MSVTHVKICGFQTVEPMRAAIEAGADAVGLVFIPSARRGLTLDDAGRLLAEVRGAGLVMPKVVGLFGDQPFDEVATTAEALQLDAVQLCGQEGMEYCAHLRIPIYKVISVDPQVPVSAQMPRIMLLQQRHALAGHRIVIDTKIAGEYGGTGQRFDWELASDLAQAFEMCLAGGLSPENVAEAVSQVRPWGVDASSGVETDGAKDVDKVRSFVAAVRAAEPRKRSGIWGRLLRRNS